MEEKEFYKYTYQELITKVGEERAREIANYYKTDFLVKYPKTICVIEGNLMKTYKEIAA